MGRIILIISTTLLLILFVLKTYFFNFNGPTTIDLYERLPLFFSTSKYTFLICFFVIGALFYWIYMNIKERTRNFLVSNLQTFLFIIITILQIISLNQWHEDNFLISLMFAFLQILILFLLYLTYPISKDSLKLRAPIAIYFSWTTFDFLIKVSYLLVYIEWNGFGLSNALWAVIFMTGGVLVCLHLRYHHFDIIYPIVFIWGYIGIVLKNGLNELFVTAAALFLIGVLIVGTIYLKKKPAKVRA